MISLLAFACQQAKESNADSPESSPEIRDTLVARKVITNEIAGSNYRKRGTSYFLVVRGDTSDNSYIFSEGKDNNKVTLDLKISSLSSTYSQRMTELKYLLPEVKKDYTLDSLQSINMGRLVSHGDIAIAVTKQWNEQYGNANQSPGASQVGELIKSSQLSADWNSLLSPYNLEVKGASPEKIFFAAREQFLTSNKLVTDTTAVPSQILDCMLYLSIGPKNIN